MLGAPLTSRLMLCEMLHFLTDADVVATRETYKKLRFLVIGYLLHYLPFFPMTRVLYPHHYLPAYVYSAMCVGELSFYV